jgi:hypothetical protein
MRHLAVAIQDARLLQVSVIVNLIKAGRFPVFVLKGFLDQFRIDVLQFKPFS